MPVVIPQLSITFSHHYAGVDFDITSPSRVILPHVYSKLDFNVDPFWLTTGPGLPEDSDDDEDDDTDALY